MEWILTGEDLTTEDSPDSSMPIPTCDDTPLQSEEADLIAMFRLLPEEERGCLRHCSSQVQAPG